MMDLESGHYIERTQRRMIYRKLARVLNELPGSIEDADEVIKACLDCAAGIGVTLRHERRVEAAEAAYRCADRLAHPGSQA